MVKPTSFFSGFFAPLQHFSLYPLILPLFALAACTGTTVRPSAANPVERDLFVETSQDIIEFHIKEVRPDQIALDGLHRLSELDPSITVNQDGGKIVLRYGDETQRFKAPEPNAVVPWGTLEAEVLDTARNLSPVIATVSTDRLDEGVIDSSLAALDPYSRYARPAVARERRAARDGIIGIGVTVDIHEDDVRIASVMPDTPAAVAGLLPGDHIVALDGVPVAKLGPDDIRRQLRGPAKGLVQLAVARDGLSQPMEVAVKRANIVPESVTLHEADGLAWLAIRSFNEQTGESLARLLERAHHDLGSSMRGIVLDLRDNPGGLLDQSVDVASLFLDGGDIVSTTGRNPQSIQHFVAAARGGAESLPMVVLVNGGSASASEIVASALQDAGRAVLVGTSSYGKGTVQQVLRTANDGELTVTWAQIMTRDGYPLNTHGVVPTICTAEIADDTDSAKALLTGMPSPVPAMLAEPRTHLDDAAWQTLRASCPASREKRAVDEAVATRLLTDPPLYRRVLASLGPTHLAATQ